jgi:2-methylisocitrate lyase-like PEP mutase family enzyme
MVNVKMTLREGFLGVKEIRELGVARISVGPPQLRPNTNPRNAQLPNLLHPQKALSQSHFHVNHEQVLAM